MAEHNDGAFLIENGIITNENVPLIMAHDLEAEDNVDIENQIPDLVAADDVEEENNQVVMQEELQEFPGFEMPQNGVDVWPYAISLSSSTTQSSPPVFEQDEMLGASSPAPNTAVSCYLNKSYQSDISELSEFTPSVEVEPEKATGRLKESSLEMATVTEVDGDFAAKETSDEQRGEPITSAPAVARNTLQVSSGNFTDNSECLRPNPPNSPASFRNLVRGTRRGLQLLRTNPNLESFQVQQLNDPDRPSNLFRKFGSFMLILVFLLLLAIIACLEGLVPQSYLKALLVLWILSFIGAIGCFMKACWEERELTTVRSIPRRNYGSTSNTNPCLSSSA